MSAPPPQPFPLPVASYYQNDPAKVNQAVQFLEQKATDAKKTIEELLYMLDMQEKVPWPDMLEKFSSLAASMSQVQGALKKSALQSGMEDHGALLRCHVLVPQRLQLEPDPQLQSITNNRVYSWNHDVVPDYLRTKLNPELEAEEMNLEAEKNAKGGDIVIRQISNLNKHVDMLLQTLPNVDRSTVDNIMDKPTHSKDETVKLVRAIMCGEGVKPPAAGQPRPAGGVAQQQPHPGYAGRPGGPGSSGPPGHMQR